MSHVLHHSNGRIVQHTTPHTATHCNMYTLTQDSFTMQPTATFRRLWDMTHACVQREWFICVTGSCVSLVTCSVLQHVAVCCSALQCVAVCRRRDVRICVSRDSSMTQLGDPQNTLLQHAVTCTATHYNALQHSAHWLQHTATHCNKLQHTATYLGNA